MRRRRSGVVTQHVNDIRVVILGKKGVGKSGTHLILYRTFTLHYYTTTSITVLNILV